MADPPELSASPGQEKSKHCISQVPDEHLGDAASSMVTRSVNRVGNASLNPVVLLEDCLKTNNSKPNSENECEFCGKTFKGRKGVKIHQTKSKCTPRDSSNPVDCALDSSNYESSPRVSQESNHSASPRHLQDELITLENISTKPTLLWPRMSDATSWSKLDQVVKNQPSPHLVSSDQLINNLELIIYEEAKGGQV